MEILTNPSPQNGGLRSNQYQRVHAPCRSTSKDGWLCCHYNNDPENVILDTKYNPLTVARSTFSCLGWILQQNLKMNLKMCTTSYHIHNMNFRISFHHLPIDQGTLASARWALHLRTVLSTSCFSVNRGSRGFKGQWRKGIGNLLGKKQHGDCQFCFGELNFQENPAVIDVLNGGAKLFGWMRSASV